MQESWALHEEFTSIIHLDTSNNTDQTQQLQKKKKACVFPMPRLYFHFQGAAYSYSLCLTLCHPFLADFNLYNLMVSPELVKWFTGYLSTFSLISILFIQQRSHSWEQYLHIAEVY